MNNSLLEKLLESDRSEVSLLSHFEAVFEVENY